MKKMITSLILIIGFSINIFSQTNKLFFIGVQPAVTIEPFYSKGELDINALPLIFETPISPRINLRIAPIANYHIGGTTNGFSDLGVFVVLPVFLKQQNDANSKTKGFYLGPVIGLGRNIINNHYTTTLAVEPGYMFEAKKRFTITLGIQFGASYFTYDSLPNKWVTHWGPKVTFGSWIN